MTTYPHQFRYVFGFSIVTMLAFALFGSQMATASACSPQSFQQKEKEKPTQEPTEKGPQEQNSIEIPQNQVEPIFSFDQGGGFRRAPKKTKDFQIFADGRVKATNGQSQVEFKLDKKELQTFLQFVVNKNKAYDFTTKGIEDAMMKQGDLPMNRIADATTAEVSLNLPLGKHAVSVYALFFAHSEYPELDGIKQLAAIDKRCSHIVAVKVLGDNQKGVLAFVNAEIKRKGLKIDPVSLKELRRAYEQPNGSWSATFERPQPNPENDRSRTISISYYKKDGEAKVRVFGLQQE